MKGKSLQGKILDLLTANQQGDVPKVGYFRDIPDEFKIKSLYSNDLILNIASKSKETVQKLKFLDSPYLIRHSIYICLQYITASFGYQILLKYRKTLIADIHDIAPTIRGAVV